MKKFLFLLVSLTILTGSSYALFPGLFPDTATFPRVPTGNGTIWAVISKILGITALENYSNDGSVPNSEKLDGITSTGYLRDDPSCGGGQKYIGIKPNGSRDCAATSTLLTDYGRIDNQWCTASYYRADGTNGTTNTGDTLKAGDIIKTAPGCPMNIVFADYSILRLDGDSTVSLDVGSLADGTSIASAILANGSLWWRILTETWAYSIGTETVVAWVRGTSLLVSRPGSAPTITQNAGSWELSPSFSPAELTIVHTTLPGGVAGTGTCRDLNGDVSFPLTARANIVSSTSCSMFRAQANTMALSISDIYDDIPISADYTRADLDYMSRILSGVTLSSTRYARILAEKDITTPVGLWEEDAICPDKGDPQTFWSSLIGVASQDTCQPETLRAFADYTTNIGSLYTPTGAITPVQNNFSGASLPRLVYDNINISTLLNSDFILDLWLSTPISWGLTYLLGLTWSLGYIDISYQPAPSRLVFSRFWLTMSIPVATGTAYNLRIQRTGNAYTFTTNWTSTGYTNNIGWAQSLYIGRGRFNLSNTWSWTISTLRIE
jgi:hypothetical protein